MRQLQELGLTEYEIRVYQTLLTLGSATGGQVARESGVPHGKTYQSLHSLSEKGVVRIIPVQPKLFRAVRPKEAIEALAQKRTVQIAAAAEAALATLAAAPEVHPLAIHERIAVMENTRQVMDYVVQQAKQARREIVVLSRGERLPLHTMQALAAAMARGVRIRLIVFELDGNREEVKRFIKAGLAVRYLPDYKLTILVVDAREAEIIIRNPRKLTERIGIVFENEALATMMRDWFNIIWEKARPVKL